MWLSKDRSLESPRAFKNGVTIKEFSGLDKHPAVQQNVEASEEKTNSAFSSLET